MGVGSNGRGSCRIATQLPKRLSNSASERHLTSRSRSPCAGRVRNLFPVQGVGLHMRWCAYSRSFHNDEEAIKLTRNNRSKTMNTALNKPIDAGARPPKPSTATMIASTKKMAAKRSMWVHVAVLRTRSPSPCRMCVVLQCTSMAAWKMLQHLSRFSNGQVSPRSEVNAPPCHSDYRTMSRYAMVPLSADVNRTRPWCVERTPRSVGNKVHSG